MGIFAYIQSVPAEAAQLNDMDRKSQLLKLVGDDPFLVKEVEELIFLEGQLDYLRSLPQIEVNPDNPLQQRSTVAAKEYIKYLQQYNMVVKILTRATGTDEGEEDSPLRVWAKGREKQ